jgi:hypothetical protein
MPSQQWIHRFTLDFHRLAVQRLREQPALIDRALQTLDRWEQSGAQAASRVYRDEWRQLLHTGVAAVEARVCDDTDRAATLRSASPLGFVLTEQERQQVRQAVVLD